MVLNPCRECGREIGTEATSCPHCGAAVQATPHSLSGSPGRGPLIVFAVVIGILLLLLVLVGAMIPLQLVRELKEAG